LQQITKSTTETVIPTTPSTTPKTFEQAWAELNEPEVITVRCSIIYL